MFADISIFISKGQFAKELSPTLVTLSEISTLVRFVQLLKASLPILFVPFSIVILASPEY